MELWVAGELKVGEPEELRERRDSTRQEIPTNAHWIEVANVSKKQWMEAETTNAYSNLTFYQAQLVVILYIPAQPWIFFFIDHKSFNSLTEVSMRILQDCHFRTSAVPFRQLLYVLWWYGPVKLKGTFLKIIFFSQVRK
jgi:hypothetical protein